MTISVNGEPVTIPTTMTVSALVKLLDVVPAQVAVELDGTIVPRESWSNVAISPGALLEIVRFVGGG
jgi:sulfur carrier protein